MTDLSKPSSLDTPQEESAEEILSRIVEHKVSAKLKSYLPLAIGGGTGLVGTSLLLSILCTSPALKDDQNHPAAIMEQGSVVERFDPRPYQAMSDARNPSEIVGIVSALMTTADGKTSEQELLFAYKLFSKRLKSDFSQPVGTYPADAKLDFLSRDTIQKSFDEAEEALLDQPDSMSRIRLQEQLINRVYDKIEAADLKDNKILSASIKTLLQQTLDLAKVWVEQGPTLTSAQPLQISGNGYQAMYTRLIDRLDTSKP